MANTERGTTVQAACVCRGRNQRCAYCDGQGTVTKKACLRCGGVGTEGPNAKCPDCRGVGWRDLDNWTSEI